MALFAGEMRGRPGPGFANLSDRGSSRREESLLVSRRAYRRNGAGYLGWAWERSSWRPWCAHGARVFKRRRVTRKGVRSRMTWLERRKTGTCVRDTITMGFWATSKRRPHQRQSLVTLTHPCAARRQQPAARSRGARAPLTSSSLAPPSHSATAAHPCAL